MLISFKRTEELGNITTIHYPKTEALIIHAVIITPPYLDSEMAGDTMPKIGIWSAPRKLVTPGGGETINISVNKVITFTSGI